MHAKWTLGLWISLVSFDVSVASPVVETLDRLEINWVTQKVRFFGEGSSRTLDGSEGYRAAEKRAWQEGLAYLSASMRGLYAAFPKDSYDAQASPEVLKEATKSAVTSTSSVKTIYFVDGDVRVYLETPILRTLLTSLPKFRQKEVNHSGDGEKRGVIFRLDRPTKPQAVYRIQAEDGEVLFGPQDMAEEAFRRHLMGHWFKRPTASEMAPFVGKSPLEIALKVVRDGVFTIGRGQWSQWIEGHRSMLVNGDIVLALP